MGWSVGSFAEVDIVLIVTFVKTGVEIVAKRIGLSETDLGSYHGLDVQTWLNFGVLMQKMVKVLGLNC